MRASGKEAPLVCAIVGADSFLRNEALAKLIDAVADKMDGLGPSRCDGSQASAAEVLDEVRTPSLLGDRRVVIVEEADDFISANRSALEKYCTSPAESGCLVLLCGSLPRNTRLCRILAERGAVVTCEAPRGPAFNSWIAQQAEKEYGKRIAAQAVGSLRRLLGDSPGWIDAELSKLASFVGDREEITAADVEELTDQRREEKVFAVIDAVIDGEPRKALGQLGQVPMRSPGDEQRALGGLAYSMRQYIAAKRELEATGNVYQAAKRMFMDAGTLQRRLQRVTIGRLLEQQQDLLASDLAVKTGLSRFDSAMERFIVKHGSSVCAAQTRKG